ncbi:uncharacterized protein LOC128205664 [Mya arenaria]|uniref:uncharacterized protein LOC128205664 n=1 Tax=Mya arenaria TaxID=6604 RepID=UPI0022DF0999|nr:uncharacterized protein LOC128205664 [Mya arenaria]
MSSGILSARSRSIRENETPLSLPLAEDSEKRAVAAVYRKHADYIKQNVQLTRTHIRKLLTTGGVITQREFDSLCRKSDPEALDELLQVLPKKGPHGFKVFVFDILYEDFRAVGEFLDEMLHAETEAKKTGRPTSSESDLSPMSPNNAEASSTKFTPQSTVPRRQSSMLHTRSNEDLESQIDEHQHQINRIFSTMSTNMNYRQFRCQTPELATLDKIESHTKSLLKIIDDCCKQFDLQTSKKSLKSSIIDLKLDRDNIFRKSKDQRSFLETKLRNERDKNEKLETMVKELQEFKDMFEGYTKAREMSQALREMKTEKKRVTDELEKIKEENKQLSRTLETTQAVLDIYKENATRAENELDRYKKLVTRLENDNGELSLKLCTYTDLTSNDIQSSSLTVTHDNRPSSKPYRPPKIKKKRQRKKHLA